MATIPANFLAELKKGVNTPNVIVEIALDGGTKKIGLHVGGLTDVIPALGKVPSLQNKIDTNKGFATRGKTTFTIMGRDNFKSMIATEYLKNRSVLFKQGFVVDGYAYADYFTYHRGIISDWSRNGEELTISVTDDLAAKGKIKIPVPVDATLLTTLKSYQNTNPVDIILDIVKNQLGVPAAQVDTTNMEAERDDWIPSLMFERVLTEPREGNKYLNELQIEAGLFVFHNGEKVDLKIFAPKKPGQTLDIFTDDNTILRNSLQQQSGYPHHFHNRVIVYSDYDESGGDNISNYEYAAATNDAVSAGSGVWDEVSIKIIKCNCC